MHARANLPTPWNESLGVYGLRKILTQIPKPQNPNMDGLWVGAFWFRTFGLQLLTRAASRPSSKPWAAPKLKNKKNRERVWSTGFGNFRCSFQTIGPRLVQGVGLGSPGTEELRKRVPFLQKKRPYQCDPGKHGKGVCVSVVSV